MDAKLMGATGQGIKRNERFVGWDGFVAPFALGDFAIVRRYGFIATVIVDDFVIGDGFFAELMIDHLAGAIVGIDREGERDDSALALQFSLEPCKIALVKFLFDKELIQCLEGLCIL